MTITVHEFPPYCAHPGDQCKYCGKKRKDASYPEFCDRNSESAKKFRDDCAAKMGGCG